MDIIPPPPPYPPPRQKTPPYFKNDADANTCMKFMYTWNTWNTCMKLEDKQSK